ncbi:MAG: Ig-like domain-containing protein, partial [Candidatus Poribacteria bacterium]|nr:Ig-like domain-containing protein [Candidatus Poribacteria bacterium]
MKKQLIGFTFLFFVCLLMPFVAMADFSVDLSRSDPPWTIIPGESITLTVKVQENGYPASGQTVTFSVTRDGELTADEFASVSPTSATTDSNGQAQTTLSVPSDTSAFQYVVWAKLDNGQSDSYSVPVTVASDGAELGLAMNNQRTYKPGESVGFTFWLQNYKDGTGVSGKTVTFSVSPDNGTASLSPTSATTDRGGAARTTLVLGSNASGRYSVTATLDGGKSVSRSTRSVHNPNKPSGFFLGMEVANGVFPLNPGESRTFTAHVQKLVQNVGRYRHASGETVTFSVSPNDGTVSLSATSATTDSNGKASTSLITGSGSSGTYTVTATVANGQSISGTTTVEASSSPPPTDPNPDPLPEVIQIPQEQQAAPEGPTGNTPGQQAAPEGPTGNTQGTPRSVTTNTPANTTRTPTPDTPEQQASDLVVDALEVNKNVLDAGESFTLSAVVRNQSEELSSTGTLTYYQYFDDKSVE